MKKYIFKILIWTGALLLNSLMVIGQECAGSLEVLLQGSNSADSLIVELTVNGISCHAEAEGNILLQASGGSQPYIYEWIDTSANLPEREDLTAGDYEVTITDQLGCEEIVQASIQYYSPANSALAFSSGCGNCILTNGIADYFFNENGEYLASILDAADDNIQLGDTEVCLNWDSAPSYCDNNPHLQRSWSVTPSTDSSSCLELFFTQEEFEALADATGLIPAPDPVALINDQAYCLTAFSGGTEDCSNYSSAKIYAQTDITPLEITLADADKGIWSVSTCVDEYATFYFHLCDMTLLPLQLISFYGEVKAKDNLLFWQTASEKEVLVIHLEYSRNGEQWHSLESKDPQNEAWNNYQSVHANPGIGLFYYRLKIVEFSGAFYYSHSVALQRGENDRNEKFYPTKFSEGIYYDSFLPKEDELEFVFLDEVGRLAHRENVIMDKGQQRHYFYLPRLASGAYFVRVRSLSSDVQTSHKVICIRKR